MDRLTVRAAVVSAIAISALATIMPPISPATSSLQALPFLLVSPGLAWLGNIRNMKILQIAALAIGLSLAAETLIGTLLFVFGRWSPQIGHGLLILLTLLGVLVTWRGEEHGSRRRVRALW
jgi:hypothetical protein